MTFKEYSDNYDGCIYVVSFEKETFYSAFHHYFMKYENAIAYLWDFYLYHYGDNLDVDDRDHMQWILETTGYIEGVGHIDEVYFEDFEE